MRLPGGLTPGPASGDVADSCAAHQAVAHACSDDLKTAVFRGFQRDQNVEQIPFTRSTLFRHSRYVVVEGSPVKLR